MAANKVSAKHVDPKKLITSIKKMIDDGSIRTWSYDTEGDFIFMAEQYKGKGWLRPSIGSAGWARFSYLKNKNEQINQSITSIYLGHFSILLTTHFPDSVERVLIF